MIKFTSINIDGNEVNYEFDSAEALEKEWNSNSIDMNVPANDDPIYDVEIDGKLRNLAPTIRETNDECNCLWFEDLLTYLGIDI